MFVFNARAEHRLECNKTVKYRQVKFHSKSNLLIISYGIRVFMFRMAAIQRGYTPQHYQRRSQLAR